MTRAITEPVDERFADVDEPTPPPAPSRPADGPRIRGVAADAWAQGIERKLDEMTTATADALQAHGENSRVLATEIRDGFAKIFEVLKTQERHEQQLREHRSDLNKLEARVTKLETAATRRKRK